jgi:hypothetical protein
MPARGPANPCPMLLYTELRMEIFILNKAPVSFICISWLRHGHSSTRPRGVILKIHVISRRLEKVCELARENTK